MKRIMKNIFNPYRREMKNAKMQRMLDRTAEMRKALDKVSSDRILQTEELDEFFRNSMTAYNAM